MKESAILIQRLFRMKQCKLKFKEYFRMEHLRVMNYEDFMEWCSNENTKRSAYDFLCELFPLNNTHHKNYTKILNLLIFSYFHPILFGNKSSKEIMEISEELHNIRKTIMGQLLQITKKQTYNSFCLTKHIIRKTFMLWMNKIKEWKEIDKCLLVQECIVQYFELENLEEQLLEELEHDYGTPMTLELNKITRGRIVIEKTKCKEHIKKIDGERGLRVMNNILEETQKWENSKTMLMKQIKEQMEKAYWESIQQDIESNSFKLVKGLIKEVVDNFSQIYSRNRRIIHELYESIDFDFMEDRCKYQTADGIYWTNIFYTLLDFLERSDSKENIKDYSTKKKEVEAWDTKIVSYEKIKECFLWIRERQQDVLDRKQEIENSPLFQQWIRDNSKDI